MSKKINQYEKYYLIIRKLRLMKNMTMADFVKS